MQQPRRTSEFCDELPGTATKRRSKQQPRLTAASPCPGMAMGTAQKYVTRKSRTTLIPTSSAMRRTTPQNVTPAKFSTTRTTVPRVLFTAEKQRGTVGVAGVGLALHNDKKWVQEQMQCITDYLIEPTSAGAIPGVSQEFFAKPGALRQMSIKHFVAIINYFLQFVGGSRLSVGANHVEDVVNILQKLHYPHQINKSWLKTPNAQHCFGHVIMVLDFLIDFVPTLQTPDKFPFDEPGENTLNNLDDKEYFLTPPDAEFQAQMLQNAALGFTLWDKQLMEEFTNLQQKTCNELVQRRCGVKDLTELDHDISKLREDIVELEKARPCIRKEDEEYKLKLEEKCERSLETLELLRNDLETNEQNFKQLLTKKQESCNEFTRLTEAVVQLQSTIRKQTLNIEQRDKLVEEAAQLKHVAQCHDRTLRELQDRNNRQQVLLSRTKKQITDQVEKFNILMREIAYSEITDIPIKALQLPLNPVLTDLDQPLQIIAELLNRVQLKLQNESQAHSQLEHVHAEILREIDTKLVPQVNEYRAALANAQTNWQRYEKEANTKCFQMDELMLSLQTKTKAYLEEIQQYEQKIVEKQNEIECFKKDNEQIMCKAEEEFNAYADKREHFLKQYEAVQEKASAELEELKEIVNQNLDELAKLKSEAELYCSNDVSHV